MAVKLRLRRQGRKALPYYNIVVADGRSPRDGKFIEQIGVYNPTTVPATIEVNHDKAIEWLKNGAQPTDTVRAILRYVGVTVKFALIKQGKSPEQVETIYNKWLTERENRVSKRKLSIENKLGELKKLNMERETEKRKQVAERIASKNTPIQDTPEAPVEETPSEQPE